MPAWTLDPFLLAVVRLGLSPARHLCPDDALHDGKPECEGYTVAAFVGGIELGLGHPVVVLAGGRDDIRRSDPVWLALSHGLSILYNSLLRFVGLGQ